MTPNPAAATPSDIFCQIISGGLDAAVVARTEQLIAFLDHRPVFKGHVLIAPVTHVDTLLDLPQDLMTPLLTLGAQVAAALGAALGAVRTCVRSYVLDPDPASPSKARLRCRG